jgi:SAM-dependent methyltransferase
VGDNKTVRPALRRLGWLAVPLAAGLLVATWRRRKERAANGDGNGGGGWYRWIYRVSYLVGFTPWDRGVPLGELVRLVEGPQAPAPGRALDLGCGTGTNSIYLARHGWDVTGVDVVPRALAEAQRAAGAAGVAAAFVEGDVTDLESLGLAGGFDLLVDAGCYHTIPRDGRDGYVRGVTALAAPGATLLLFGFASVPVASMGAGLKPDDVRDRFAGWEVVSVKEVTSEDLREQLGANRPGGREPRMTTWAARRFQPWQYVLRRKP